MSEITPKKGDVIEYVDREGVSRDSGIVRNFEEQGDDYIVSYNNGNGSRFNKKYLSLKNTWTLDLFNLRVGGGQNEETRSAVENAVANPENTKSIIYCRIQQ